MMKQPEKITDKEIQTVIDEYYNEHTVHGTDKPVVISENTAQAIIRSRRSREKFLNSVHDSHDMTEWYSDIRAPAGTPRFYSVRHCKRCEYEQMEHTAGRFIDPPLERRCPELPPIEKDYDI